MTYNELLTELAVIQAFIEKFKNETDTENREEVLDLKEQEQYLIDKILELQN